MPPILPLPCLALVTDRKLCTRAPLVEAVSQALAGGVNLVQLREKDLSAQDLLKLAQQLREVTKGRALLLVNDRLDVALACGADGVQLGEEGLPLEAARALVGRELLLGRSVHSVDGARKAAQEEADLLLVGTLFPSESHPGAPPAGTALLQQVAQVARLPLLGIGGITSQNLANVLEAGASGVAVIRGVLGSADPKGAAQELRRVMEEAWAMRRAYSAH